MQINESTTIVDQISVDDIVRVYSGRPGCGCGCRGTYSTDARNIKRVVNVINKSFAIGNERGVRKGVSDGIAYVEGATRFYWAYTNAAS